MAHLYSTGEQSSMMEESVEEAQRRDEILRMYHASKEALSIIQEISTSTVTVPTPPPVKDDWLEPSPGSVTTPYNGRPPSPARPRPPSMPNRPGDQGSMMQPMQPTRSVPNIPNRPAPDAPNRPAPSIPARPGSTGGSISGGRGIPKIPDRPLNPSRPQ